MGATSGDTGAAAPWFIGQGGVTSFILYPDGRISATRAPMTMYLSATFSSAIQGSFDDAQMAMKTVFQDRSFAQKVGLSFRSEFD